MKINLSYEMVDMDDAPVLENEKSVSAQTAFKRALINSDTKDKKLETFELFLKVKSATPETDFTIDEVALLNDAIKGFPVLFFGQLYLLLGK